MLTYLDRLDPILVIACVGVFSFACGSVVFVLGA